VDRTVGATFAVVAPPGREGPAEQVDGLDVVVLEHDGSTLLRVVGEIDSYTAPLLRRRLVEQVDRRAVEVVVDLAETTLIDSTGLGVLVAAAARLREAGGRLVVLCPSPFLREVFALSGVDQLLDIVTSDGPAGG
jgi:anti-anti-sigma factor